MRARNLTATLIQFAASSSANTEFTVAHELPVIPLDAFVVVGNQGAILYKSGTAWTATNAYLKCDTGSAQFIVLFFV